MKDTTINNTYSHRHTHTQLSPFHLFLTLILSPSSLLESPIIAEFNGIFVVADEEEDKSLLSDCGGVCVVSDWNIVR
jgi:hypothetical protein